MSLSYHQGINRISYRLRVFAVSLSRPCIAFMFPKADAYYINKELFYETYSFVGGRAVSVL